MQKTNTINKNTYKIKKKYKENIEGYEKLKEMLIWNLTVIVKNKWKSQEKYF